MKKIILQCSWAVFDFRHVSGNSAPEHSFQALLRGTYAAFQTDRDAADVGRWHPSEEAAAVRSSGTGREQLYRGSSGVKHLCALHFSVFGWLVGVSAFNGEPPAEAVRRQQIASFKRTGYNNSTTAYLLFWFYFLSIFQPFILMLPSGYCRKHSLSSPPPFTQAWGTCWCSFLEKPLPIKLFISLWCAHSLGKL